MSIRVKRLFSPYFSRVLIRKLEHVRRDLQSISKTAVDKWKRSKKPQFSMALFFEIRAKNYSILFNRTINIIYNPF